MAVLVGYAVALGGTSSGHGLRLAVHLFTEHHEATHHHGHERPVAFTAPLLGAHGASRAGGRVWGQQAASDGRGGTAPRQQGRLAPRRGTVGLYAERLAAHNHDEARHEYEAHSDHGGAEEGVHSHHGRVHSHREAPPAPALVSIELDKHCVFPGPHVCAPDEARRLDWPVRAATPAPVVLAVEVRPPQIAA